MPFPLRGTTGAALKLSTIPNIHISLSQTTAANRARPPCAQHISRRATCPAAKRRAHKHFLIVFLLPHKILLSPHLDLATNLRAASARAYTHKINHP